MRRRVYDAERHVHFVTFSCYRRRKLLDHPQAKRIVLGTLHAQLRRLEGKCVGFVLMPEHLHVLLWFPESGSLSECLKQWKRTSSYRLGILLKERLTAYASTTEESPPVWQPRYYDFNIFSPRKLAEKLRYMHANPVRRGLAAEPCEWPWSSARFYEQGRSVGIPIWRITEE